MVKKSLSVIIFIITQTNCIMGMQPNNNLLGAPNIEKQYNDHRQEHKNVFFTQVPDESQNPYLSRLGGAFLKGPLGIAEQGSALAIMWGLQNLKTIAFPDPKEVLNGSLESAEFTNKSIQWSHNLLEVCNGAIKLCPSNDEKEMYLGYYNDIEELLLSSDYYKEQSNKVVLKKLAQLNEIMQIDAPNIGATGKKMLESKTKEDKERYGRLYSINLNTTLKLLHEVVTHEEGSFNLSRYAEKGALVAVGGLAGGAIMYLFKNSPTA